MVEWFSNNIGTILTVTLLTAVIAAVIIKIIRDKKSGKSCCGCGCGNCPTRDFCHKK